MENENTFKYLLDGLAMAVGLSKINISEDGSESLLTIDDFEVSLNCLDTGSFLIFTTIAPMPEKGREQIMAGLLEANTFLTKTHGFTLAAREDTGVTLQGIAPLAILDRDNITTFVENFVNVAEHWQRFCREGRTEETAVPDAGGIPDGIMGTTLLKPDQESPTLLQPEPAAEDPEDVLTGEKVEETL